MLGDFSPIHSPPGGPAALGQGVGQKGEGECGAGLMLLKWGFKGTPCVSRKAQLHQPIATSKSQGKGQLVPAHMELLWSRPVVTPRGHCLNWTWGEGVSITCYSHPSLTPYCPPFLLLTFSTLRLSPTSACSFFLPKWNR